MGRDINFCAAQHRLQGHVAERLAALEAGKHEIRDAGLMQFVKDRHGAL